MNIKPRFPSLNAFWPEEEEKEETLGLCEMFIQETWCKGVCSPPINYNNHIVGVRIIH